jgi:RNA polymerase sigma factor (sigma-70 family)
MYPAAVRSIDSEANTFGSRQNAEPNARAGDSSAFFRTVVLPHLDAAYNLAYWLVGNRTDAEDVVQGASLCALRFMRGYAGGNARAWMLRIVRNNAYSWLRKNHSAATVTVEDIEAVEAACAKSVDAYGETPEAGLIAKAAAEDLRRAIAALPPLFRETLVLRDVEGLEYREIAVATDVSIGTVMSRLATARRRLAAIVGTEIERVSGA